ncbi:MAG: hypothetical protein RR036_00905 [Oscillospiraceae bacterium]
MIKKELPGISTITKSYKNKVHVLIIIVDKNEILKKNCFFAAIMVLTIFFLDVIVKALRNSKAVS